MNRLFCTWLLMELVSRAVFAQPIDTVAGTGAAGFAGDGGDARAALVDGPRALALRPETGDLFILDYSNNRVRKVDARGVITTVAGSGEIGPLAEGPAVRSPFIQLHGVAWNSGEGKLYLAESGALLAVDSEGDMKAAMIGRAVPVLSAAPGTSAVLFSDFLNVYRRDPDGTVVLLAGGDEQADSGDGGPATDARFLYVSALAGDRLGRIWVADSEARRVRRFLPGGTIETVAGGGADAPESLGKPVHIAVDVAGNLYIADRERWRIYRLPSGGQRLELFAGDGREELRGDGGPATEASFAALNGIAVNCAGVYVSDMERVRRIALSDPLIALRGVFGAEPGDSTLRPGRRFALEGCHLAETAVRADDSQPLPLRLGGAEVLVDGVPAPMVAASPERLEALLPVVSRSGAVTVQVNVRGTSVTARVEIQ